MQRRTLASTRTFAVPPLDAWLSMRDRLLTSAAIQRWAMRFPLTRRIARRRARSLFDLCAGFVYSQVLFACVELGLFELLAEGPLCAEALSRRLSLPLDATTRLLAAARSLDLVDVRGRTRYGLGHLGAALLGNPSLTALIEHHALLYADLHDPVAILRGDSRSRALAGYWPYAGAGRPADLTRAEISSYTALMSASQAMIAAQVLDAYPLHRHRCLLDVGGGDGAFLAAAAARNEALQVILFDLPAVADLARARFAASGISHRARATGGDFHNDVLPAGADIVSLVRVIHDHDDAAALGILKAVRAALPEHGTLLLAEPMSGTPGAEPIGDAYFGFYLMAMGSGRPRTPAELGSLLEASGFRAVTPVATRTPMLTSVLVARVGGVRARKRV